MDKEYEPYNIVWQPFSVDSPIAKRLGSKEQVYLPYFIDGESLKELQGKRPVPLNEFGLLRGILASYFDVSPYLPLGTDTIQHHLEVVIHDLTNVFKFKSTEKMILDTSAILRDKNGPWVSRAALQTGMRLIPDSSFIRSDFIMDVWCLLKEEKPHQQQISLDEITRAYSGLDLDTVLAGARELLLFANFVSLSFLGRLDERDTFMESAAFNQITSKYLMTKVLYVLNNKDTDINFVLS
ncbi:MAG TPA: hypothetical protein VFD58_11710 [Blastocatellia bacterium]|nr:hypothetical protein [Blastocatellia bacterium]